MDACIVRAKGCAGAKGIFGLIRFDHAQTMQSADSSQASHQTYTQEPQAKPPNNVNDGHKFLVEKSKVEELKNDALKRGC